MEYLDVLNERGEKTGERKLRSEVHRDGDWHRAVHMWLINPEGELLIQKRSPHKYTHPNKWAGSVAGHISAGDSSQVTAVREMGEELGVSVNADDLTLITTITKQSILNEGAVINSEFVDIYLLNIDLDLSTVKLQEEEVSEVKFVEVAELKRLIVERADEFVQDPKEYAVLFEHLQK